MARIDPKMKAAFEAKSRDLVKRIQDLYNTGKMDELAKIFCAKAVVILAKSHKIFEGAGIQRFWSQAQASGITNLKLVIENVFITSADLLVLGKDGHAKYDMVAHILGQYAFTFARKDGKKAAQVGLFMMEDGHLQPCDPKPFGMCFDM